MAKKRHHYAPVTYLSGFADRDGRVWVFRKNGANIFHTLPKNIGYRKFYYAQYDEKGCRDTDLLEGVFSEQEAKWPRIREQIREGCLDEESMGDLFTFIILQRVRVPAFREAVERTLQYQVQQIGKELVEDGEVEPPPPGLDWDKIDVSIDPQKSLEYMVDAMPEILEKILHRAEYKIVRALEGSSFVTSDNPVLWFNPRTPEARMQPYKVSIDGPVEVIFPVCGEFLIHGLVPKQFRGQPIPPKRRRAKNLREMRRFNRLISKFGYEFVISRDRALISSLSTAALYSPTPFFEQFSTPAGRFETVSMRFGKVETMPKWKGVK